jgi:hypothetical protein
MRKRRILPVSALSIMSNRTMSNRTMSGRTRYVTCRYNHAAEVRVNDWDHAIANIGTHQPGHRLSLGFCEHG